MKNIKILILFLFSVFLFSCRTTTTIPVETIYRYIDSTITVVDTVHIDIPHEVIVDVVPQYDTLNLETSVAKAKAYVDTTNHTLKGSIENKPVTLDKEIVYQDKIIIKEQIKEVPVPVIQEKIIRKNPWYFPIVLLFAGLGVATIIKILIRLYVRPKA